MSRQLPSQLFRASQYLRTSSGTCSYRLTSQSSLLRPKPLLRLPRNHAYTIQHPPNASTSKVFPSAKLAAYCAISTLFGTLYYTTTHPELNDAPPSITPINPTTLPPSPTSTTHPDDTNQVPTGNSTVPFFPRIIHLPLTSPNTGKSAALPAGTGAASASEEYHLLGLGIRTVSFLRIQVYVVGIYVALSDLGKLQEGMVRSIAGGTASTLVDGEKEELRKVLLAGEGSERVWGHILKEEGLKSAARIVPVRNTDFGHLRDGWVRGIDARGKGPGFEDENFKTAVGEFKGVFGGRKGVGKGKVLLLGRGEDGALGVWVEEEMEGKTGEMVRLGGVRDERVARLVWLGYLAGGTVASEGARRSVVEGVMELVERPIGTVETQVV